MNKYRKSKTSLFLMEIIITVMFFSVAGAVCMQLFVQTHLTNQKTRELNHAVAKAQGFAEVMRGTDGSIDAVMDKYPTAIYAGDSFFEVYYDEDFEPCDFPDAVYVGDVTLAPIGAIQNMNVKIVRLSDYEVIFTLDATKYMNTPKG